VKGREKENKDWEKGRKRGEERRYFVRHTTESQWRTNVQGREKVKRGKKRELVPSPPPSGESPQLALQRGGSKRKWQRLAEIGERRDIRVRLQKMKKGGKKT